MPAELGFSSAHKKEGPDKKPWVEGQKTQGCRCAGAKYLPMNLVEPSNSSLHPFGMYAMDLQRRFDLCTGAFSENQVNCMGQRAGQRVEWVAASGASMRYA